MKVVQHSFTHQVSSEYHLSQARVVLAKDLGMSRQLLTRLKRSGALLVNGHPALLKDLVQADDRLHITIQEEKEQDISPEPMELDIVFEDEHVIIINKDPGIVVHPTKGYLSNTVANGVIHHWQAQGHGFVFRPVHRLDRDTSGLLIIAKNTYIQDVLTEQHHSGLWQKSYTAVVSGVIKPDRGIVEAPIARVGNGSRARVISEQGKPSTTLWEVVERFSAASLIKAQLVTGRTHQIRVHMAYIGHPLIGDDVYGVPTPNIARQALHASEISFVHPITREEMQFICPLPEDIRRLLERLASGRA